MVVEAYLDGVSTRKVDDLVKASGADTGILKSEVSKICAGLDAGAAQFRDRTLSSLDYPYVFLDATDVKARVNHRIVFQAIVVAVGVAADGRREVLGFDDADTEDKGFWTAFLQSLKAQGLDGVKLVIPDAHSGLKKAISTVFQGAKWERCRDQFMRNVVGVVSKGSQDMVASIIRTVFAQLDREHIHAQFDGVTRMLARSHPKVVTMLDDPRNNLLAFACFPQRHWRRIWCTNPLDWVNKEIKRRTDVVVVFPNPAALLRLAGAVLIEQHDEWEAGDRRYFSESSMLELKTMNFQIEPAEELDILPDFAAAETKTTDPHGVEKLHHSAGRYRSQPSPRPLQQNAVSIEESPRSGSCARGGAAHARLPVQVWSPRTRCGRGRGKEVHVAA